ncbi:MAG: LssY C-terminal domain-containing protein [Tardiphaga sp.]
MSQRHRRSRIFRIARVTLLALIVYGGIAYLLLPELWTHYEHQQRLAGMPMTTTTAQGIPGDAINVGLIGDLKDVLCAMHAAGWYPADPVTWRTSVEIVGSVLLDLPYLDAPVSSLRYLDRREDLAFEKSVGGSADQRHHARLWKVLDKGDENRPVWLGAATFDRGVGISHYTGAVTHHIAPDIDAERKVLADNLQSAGMVDARYQVTGVGPTLAGRNGGGDLYYTDGEVWIMRLVVGCAKRTAPVETIPSPAATEIKDQIFHAVANAIGPVVTTH